MCNICLLIYLTFNCDFDLELIVDFNCDLELTHGQLSQDERFFSISVGLTEQTEHNV